MSNILTPEEVMRRLSDPDLRFAGPLPLGKSIYEIMEMDWDNEEYDGRTVFSKISLSSMGQTASQPAPKTFMQYLEDTAERHRKEQEETEIKEAAKVLTERVFTASNFPDTPNAMMYKAVMTAATTAMIQHYHQNYLVPQLPKFR